MLSIRNKWLTLFILGLHFTIGTKRYLGFLVQSRNDLGLNGKNSSHIKENSGENIAVAMNLGKPLDREDALHVLQLLQFL